MTNPENKNTNSTQFSDTLACLESSIELIPKEVLECIYGGFNILKSLTEKGKLPKNNIGIQIDLLKKMGIIPSSEKFSARTQGKNKEEIKELSSSELEEKLKNDLKANKIKIEHCQKNTKSSWIALIKLRNEQKRIEGKLMELDKAKIEKMVLDEEKRLENPEDLRNKLEQIEREENIPDEELKVPTEPKLEPISEKMFEEPAVFAKETTTIFNLEDEVKNSITGKIKTFYSERTKFNIEFSVIKEHHLVEQIYSYEQDNLFTAKVKNLGPKGFRVTYETISFLVVMISCYYIPINRISKMLCSHGKAAFGSSSICRYLKYFAQCILPVNAL